MDQSKVYERYKKRMEFFGELAAKHSGTHRSVSYLRAAVFVSGLVLGVYFVDDRQVGASLLTAAVWIFLFALLVKWHNRIGFKRDFNQALRDINEEEIFRLDFDLNRFDPGADFLDEKHPYAIDLDLFGKASLFQALNRTATPFGRGKLAGYLLQRSDAPLIAAQQEAVIEVSGQADWRQQFQAHGRLFKDKYDNANALIEWTREKPAVKNETLYSAFLWIMPGIFFAILAAVIFAGLSVYWLLAPIAISSFFISQFKEAVENIYEKTARGYKILFAVEALVGEIERKTFSARRLNELQAVFSRPGLSASGAIRDLRKILSGLETRGNMLYHLINPILLLDLVWVLRAEKWKRKHGRHSGEWFDAIGEIDVINSLAGFAAANPDYVFPEIADENYRFKSKKLGHPLIKRPRRVYNDFEFIVEKQITLITGSNMSGKSTFLRTVGVNTVLALIGAPVCAEKLEISCFDLYTGMRTQDNLEDNVSSFYAELSRIHDLLHYIDGKRKVLFMLDEILKGTNSRDRHRGAVALARQLSGMNVSGFISTHDLELCYLENENAQIKNYSFESRLSGEELVFDYKIKKGVTESFNASVLMARMGIDMGEAPTD